MLFFLALFLIFIVSWGSYEHSLRNLQLLEEDGQVNNYMQGMVVSRSNRGIQIGGNQFYPEAKNLVEFKGRG